LKIKKLVLNNFSSYEGKTAFDFSVHGEDKNIILIGGQNGSGKTSLFTGIKIALYGPLYFNYQSANQVYFTRIKELINHNAFIGKTVEASVNVNIDLLFDREYVNYDITRKWVYSDQKISEELIVYKGKEQLIEEDLVFFQNFLLTVLPPNLFDFFFFDGETVADFFVGTYNNTYIKNAILTLCGIDTLEIVRKLMSTYVPAEDENNELQHQFNNAMLRIDTLANTLIERKAELAQSIETLQNFEIEREALSEEFKNAGGISNENKQKLIQELKDNENIKTAAQTKLKAFIETTMPFLILEDLLRRADTQLRREDEFLKFRLIEQKLSASVLGGILADLLTDMNSRNGIADRLNHRLSDSLKPDFDIEGFVCRHDLSAEQKEKTLAFISLILQLDREEIFGFIDEKKQATAKTESINKKLRKAMDDKDVESFVERLSNLKAEIASLKQKQIDLDGLIIQLTAEHEEAKKEKDHAYDRLKTGAQNKNIYAITQKIEAVANRMIEALVHEKFAQLELEIAFMLKRIMRKDDFIDYVEIDNDFSITLYQRQRYSLKELKQLLSNIGSEGLSKRLGKRGTATLLKEYGLSSIGKLKGIAVTPLFTDELDLYQRVDFPKLSKGEKQIFILSFYWAIIKVSGKNIPFIIDTPFARIDTIHRDTISREFFPKISGQVVILSTDEEINETYYRTILPHLSKEYLLINNNNVKTSVENRYFFKR